MKQILTTLLVCGLLFAIRANSAEPVKTGPETEKRFPPLKVPAGFRATLFACDPLVEYPSSIALGPRPGTLYVAFDYMTGLGTEIIRRDEVRLVEDTDGDGYADRTTVMADGFNSIMGMTFHDGVVYVVHSPFVTAIRDTNGDGVADERRDLLSGVGLTPEENPVRLHCGNGIVMGHDGWLYIALGDHGCNIPRPEGDRLVVEGGAILRCRPDGRDVHVFSRGLRNIYDVALDEELNVFVRDNENDGGDYKIRICHSFVSADHGYPYLYYERPDEALRPLADLGLGSSAGGLCYLEHQFPPEYQHNLFYCEWGRAVMRCVPRRDGGGFGRLEEIEFASGANNDPYGFKPTDVVVDRDGSLLIADWADGQRPKRGRARIYRIAHESAAAPSISRPALRQPDAQANSMADTIAKLDSTSYYERIAAQSNLEKGGRDVLDAVRTAMRENRLSVRGRLHGVWILAKPHDMMSLSDLLTIARGDSDPRVRAQAVRAIADLCDPVLMQHRLSVDASNDEVLSQGIAAFSGDQDERVVLETIVAVGRLRWQGSPAWIAGVLAAKEWHPAILHASMQTMRSSGNWQEILRILDRPENDVTRAVTLRAAAGSFDSSLIDGLISRLKSEQQQQRRIESADLLSRVHKKPPPWVYWDYRPLPRTPNSVDWEKSADIGRAMDDLLADPERNVRIAVMRRMQREKIPPSAVRLCAWLRDEHQPEHVAAILESLRDLPARDTRASLAAVVRDAGHTLQNRNTATAILVQGMDMAEEGLFVELAEKVEPGPVLADFIRGMAGLNNASPNPVAPGPVAASSTPLPKYSPSAAMREKAQPLLIRFLRSASPEVRTAAVEAVMAMRVSEAGKDMLELLHDNHPRVRQVAARACGDMKLAAAKDRILELARDPDPGVRRAGLTTSKQLGDSRVLPLAISALKDAETQLAALDCVGAFGGPSEADDITNLAKWNPSASILDGTVRLLGEWTQKNSNDAQTRADLDHYVAMMQGMSGCLLRWQCIGPLDEQKIKGLVDQATSPDYSANSKDWQTKYAAAVDSRLALPASTDGDSMSYWLAATDLEVAQQTEVQFLGGTSGTWRIWLNGRQVHDRAAAEDFQPDSNRFTVTLAAGVNRVLVQVSAPSKPAEFQLHFRPISALAEHEQFVQAALTRTGNTDRGRKLVSDVEKSLCYKCHRIGELGERFGPELTGVGSRFSRIHLIESVLEPSRSMAPSFESTTVVLSDGRVLQGLKIAETEREMTFVDAKAEKFVVAKSDIETMKPQPTSPMPENLVKRFTVDEFVDLIAFLQSLKESTSK